MMYSFTFAKGHSIYQVGKLNWTPLPFEAKRSTNIPSKRYLHTAVELKGKLYILGGIDNDTDFKDQVIYGLIAENVLFGFGNNEMDNHGRKKLL